MQEYLNLEEAARALGITKEELNQKAQRREIRAFADRGTWKFRKQDIEEHVRQTGIGSGAEIVFGDLDDALPELDSGGSSDQILLSESSLEDAGPGGSAARVIGMDEQGRTPSDSDVRLVPTESKEGSDSDVKLVGATKPPSDSDVKVIPAAGAAPSDSDVKLSVPAPTDSDVRLDRVKPPSDTGIRTRSDAGGHGSTDVTQDLPVFPELEEELSIAPGSSGEQPILGKHDSDFELTPGAAGGGLSSDSDITLNLDDNTGLVPDEIKLAPKQPGQSDVTAHSPSASGVNLGSPADSGIALDRGTPLAAKSGRLPAPEGLGKSGGDIFETDFEVPVLDSDEELGVSGQAPTEQLSPDSDFELSGSDVKVGKADSSSHVLSLEGEEDVDESAATNLATSPVEEEWEEEPEAPGGFEEDSEGQGPRSPVLASDSGSPALVSVASAEPEWSVGWIIGLSVSSLVMVVLGVVMLDLVRTTWGWEDGVALYSSPILHGLQKLLPM